MPTDEGKKPAGPEKKARKQVHPQPPIDIDREPPRPSPTDRLENAKDAHILLLDQERQRLLEKVDRLQAIVDGLGPENALLREALGNAVANNILATILVAIGGGSISLAPFLEGWSKVVASGGVALLFAGVLILIVSARRNRIAKSSPPS